MGIEQRADTSDLAIKEEVQARHVGDSITYNVRRGTKVFSITVPITDFQFSDFLMTFGSFFVQGTIYLLIGVIVFILKPDNAVSWIFLLISAVTSF